MDEEVRNHYFKAGEIAALARDKGAEKIKPGVSLLEVTDYVEEIIYSNHAKPAFPVNIARNHMAAHFTPKPDDVHVFKEGDLVKLDVGAHIDGYIADTAITVEIGTDTYSSLREASEKALGNVLSMMKPGASLSTVGGIVEKIDHAVCSLSREFMVGAGYSAHKIVVIVMDLSHPGRRRTNI